MPSLPTRRARICRGFFASLALAVALAGVSAGRRVEAAPRYLVCELRDGSTIYVVVENFGGMGGAVQQCVHFWHGRPRDVVQ